MRCTDSPVTLVDEGEDVRLVLHLEAREYGIIRSGLFRLKELRLETLCVRLGAGTKVHFLQGCQRMTDLDG